ncbi:MAG: hypothetical protein KDA25_04205 [Phycisphaerales bacterium]|nr:hypothetical protein [Phycisphaerales bacterium]
MDLGDLHASFARLPGTHLAVPVSVSQCDVPLKICAVLEQSRDGGWSLKTMRDHIDGRVYLGCVLDAAGWIHEWLEIWVQEIGGIGATRLASQETLNNAMLDDRWRTQVAAHRELERAMLLHTGWETDAPPPTWLDPVIGVPVHARAGDGDAPWALCTDDAALVGAGLPPYRESLHRYLWCPSVGAEAGFVPVTDDAPGGPSVHDRGHATPGEGLVPLNPGGGLMLIRGAAAVGYESYIDYLSGPHAQSLLLTRPVLDQAELSRSSNDPEAASDGRLFLGRHGQWGRFVETLHLKLRAIVAAIEAVRRMTEQTQRPLLNLSAESFRVRLGEASAGLPHLWTARPELVSPGEAFDLQVGMSNLRYFIRAGVAGYSIYSPVAFARGGGGRATARIRKLVPEHGGGTMVEGTLATQERLQTGPNDLVWLRFALKSGRLDLYARVKEETALAAGEYRFRTMPEQLAPAVIEEVRTLEGVPLPNLLFDELPQLSSPCDLYALGVLAVRSLLVDQSTRLPEALDEMMSLARQVGVEHDDSARLGLRIRAIMDRDPRWVESLGPQHLSFDELSAEQALDLVPPELWADTLAVIIRMFAGIGPDSRCRDWGDAPVGAIHAVYDEVLDELREILVRTRSLIVIDWRFNREIHGVIRRLSTGLAGGPVGAGRGSRR